MTFTNNLASKLLVKKYFNHKLARFCYYQFGTGKKVILCFHGFGMHGKQFYCLNEEMGMDYTFIGFDLFFHKETHLHDNEIETIQKGLNPIDFIDFISTFCSQNKIERFSILSYSMGTIFAAKLLEKIPELVEDIFFIAPTFLDIKPYYKYLSKNKFVNFVFRKLALSNNGFLNLILFLKFLKIIDGESAEILKKEVATPQLRFNIYALFTYMKHFDIDVKLISEKMNLLQKTCYFIFGEKDYSVKPSLSKIVLSDFNYSKFIILPQSHNLVNEELSKNNLFCKI